MGMTWIVAALPHHTPHLHARAPHLLPAARLLHTHALPALQAKLILFMCVVVLLCRYGLSPTTNRNVADFFPNLFIRLVCV